MITSKLRVSSYTSSLQTRKALLGLCACPGAHIPWWTDPTCYIFLIPHLSLASCCHLASNPGKSPKVLLRRSPNTFKLMFLWCVTLQWLLPSFKKVWPIYLLTLCTKRWRKWRKGGLSEEVRVVKIFVKDVCSLWFLLRMNITQRRDFRVEPCYIF